MIIIIVVAISSALAHHDLGKQTKKCKPFRNCKRHTFLIFNFRSIWNGCYWMMTQHRARLFGDLKLSISLLSSFLCTAMSPCLQLCLPRDSYNMSPNCTALHIAWCTEQCIDLTEVPLHCYALLALTHTQCTHSTQCNCLTGGLVEKVMLAGGRVGTPHNTR